MQQNIYDQLDPRPAPRPMTIQGPPRLPSPQTPAQATTDQNQAAASALDPATKAAQLEHIRLENAKRQRGRPKAS
jgi:hypothetical protein